MRRLFTTLALVAAFAGCGGQSPPAEPLPTSARAPANTPPTAKDAIRYMLQNQQVPLAVHPSCAGVGTEPADTTLGDYVSGFLAEQTTGANSITAKCELQEPAGTERRWNCSVVIRHSDGDDEWGWGVNFAVRDADRTLIRDSVRCTGAG